MLLNLIPHFGITGNLFGFPTFFSGKLSFNIKGNTRENMRHMTDELLLDTYKKALKFNLGIDFIKLIEKELEKRNLKLEKRRAME